MTDNPIDVLLVEDNPGDARLIREALAGPDSARFRLTHVNRLGEALKHVREQNCDVVLLDLLLPDAHELDTVAQMHAQAPHLPIVVLTGLDDEALAIEAVREGAQDYLVKGQVDGNLLARAMRYAIERKRAEEEKKLLQEQLAYSQKMEAVGTLAGGIAHEFNNINAAIIGYVDLTLQTEKLSESARRNLETVRGSAVRGADLTKRLLAFAKKDAGEKRPLSLRSLVDDVVKVTENEFSSEGIAVTVRHSMRVPSVLGDAGLLAQVVMNLLMNARHAMLKSPVKKLTIQTGLEKRRPFIRVRDTGCGIPKENILRIFEPFFTTKGSLAAGAVFDGKVHGTGLGLSVSHSIIQGHGGEITVKSQLGKGTTFTIYFPAASGVKAQPPKTEASRERKVSRILVVDDEKDIADLLVTILADAGYAADGFINPEEALGALPDGDYSVAIIDLQMPEMTGENFIKRINCLSSDKRPVTVILTGRLASPQEDYSRLRVFATLRKPFSFQEVLSVAERALAARAASTH